MRDALAVTPVHRSTQLREVEVRDILTDALIRLDLVEEVAAIGQLHGHPDPVGVVAVGEVADYIWVAGDGAVEGELEGELFGAKAAGAEGVVLVDEFDGDDGGGCGFGGAFADAGGITLARVDCPDGRGMYEAYAPLPIVFEMIRKGSSGKGTACDWTSMSLAERHRLICY